MVVVVALLPYKMGGVVWLVAASSQALHVPAGRARLVTGGGVRRRQVVLG